ncbi:uncharacterized protein CTRU02_211341 [Colletotrichum truncatum]|uniref:Uncharacterized protein n=1 Tax=Colletotrichum truncatum TaxID=5467 RepID=A0ACC3YRN5_COLTU|nr:uncharacterized protein CTRU02_02118 [Colletotrichum truncatum]KAF6799247.1 hypothetical protein CTRU02_02118 [Colletotrichum truncatum]
MPASPPEKLDPVAMDLASIDLSSPFSPVFHKFKDLPAELRTRIWRLAAPRATVVERAMNNTTMSYTLRRHAPIPAVLHACRESRLELLYESESRRGAKDGQFETMYLSKADKDAGKGMFVNPESDTLLLYRAPHKAIMPDAANFANLQNLAMEWGLRPCWVQGHCHMGVKFIQQFSTLKTLTLLVSFKVYSALPEEDPSAKKRERIQRQRALHEIKGWVTEAIDAARELKPEWNPPEVRVVQRTKYWSGAASAIDLKKMG